MAKPGPCATQPRLPIKTTRLLPMELQIGDGSPTRPSIGSSSEERAWPHSESRPAGLHGDPELGSARACHCETKRRQGKPPVMRCVISLALAVFAAELSGCSRESSGERRTRECREIVDGATDSENATNPDVATVKRADMEAVIRSEQWATTPLRKAIQAELNKLETSRGYTSDKYDEAWDRVVNKGGERDAIWRAAFENELPRRERIRDRKIRECVKNRETKEGA